MKTDTFKYFDLALMTILMIGFTSCEVEIDSLYNDDNNGVGYYNHPADLCSHTWISLYRDMDGNCCRQKLDFFLDRTGTDYIWVEYPNGIVKQYEHSFRWSRKNYAQTSTRMSYGPSDVSYLDDVYIGGNRLNGYLDGRDNFVEFQEK